MKEKLLLIVVLLISINAFSQDEVEMVTDRPDQTESALSIPKGTFQIETGFVREFTSANQFDVTNMALNSTLLRIGLVEGLELRLIGEMLKESHVSNDLNIDSVIQGIGPFTAGVKFDLSEENGLIPQMAFIAHITFPGIGKKEFQTKSMLPDFRLSAEHTLSDKLAIGYNLGGQWNDVGPIISGIYTASLGYDLFNNIGVYVELFGEFLNEDNPFMFDGGFTFLILNNLQLDISGGIGLNDVAPDNYISFGASLRLPK